MKRRTFTFGGAIAASSILLAACGEGRTAEMGSGNDGSEGFPADARIGVSLPWLGSQNWVEAQAIFAEQLEAAGFTPIIQAADNKVPQQQQQIEMMIQQGVAAIVVGPIDGTQLGSALPAAKSAGIRVIGYDRLIANTDAVDAVVQFGSVRTGELQAESLLEGLAARKGEGPYNIELFGGGPADSNAPNFFEGSMSVLQPKIDDGTVVIRSGQTDFQQAATQDWDNGRAQSRMDSLLAANYTDEPLHGVLSPNDGIARAVITSCKAAGQDVPVVTGLDAEDESVVSIADGEQYSTVHKPTRELVAQTVAIISAYQAGEEPPATDESEDNGVIEVPIYALDPIVVTAENAEEVFADDPDRLKLLGG